jgi:Lipopolysaccharide-assembly
VKGGLPLEEHRLKAVLLRFRNLSMPAAHVSACAGLWPLAVLFVGLTSCGYHISGSGRTNLFPDTVKTISVPAFSNLTTRYKLTDFMPEAISREFITRTRYRVVDADHGDAILRGGILSFTFNPSIFDPATGRASVAEVHLTMQLTLTERATGRVLYSRPKFEVTERYQISSDPAQYFDESDPALRRACQQAAREVVSAILENF